jgi:NAD(P)-dependent dehydrogenase (short-subunit alcohol dehydrogenase family)
MTWSRGNIPDLSGKRAIVTGANSGLGLQTARELARHNCAVTLACRSQERGAAAVETIKSELGDADVTLGELDLADLSSIRRFAGTQTAPLDILVNNAGVMAVPRMTTADGFELQLGTNHLGHFALTGLLLPRLLGARARVVTVTSGAHRFGRIRFEDLMGERHYFRWTAYAQSKLANLLFAKELNRRCPDLTGVAAHPGFAATNLQQASARLEGKRVAEAFWGLTLVIGQSDRDGALSCLMAATDPAVMGGQCYGPRGFGQMRGAPGRVPTSRAGDDQEVARRLWEVSGELTGVDYPEVS